MLGEMRNLGDFVTYFDLTPFKNHIDNFTNAFDWINIDCHDIIVGGMLRYFCQLSDLFFYEHIQPHNFLTAPIPHYYCPGDLSNLLCFTWLPMTTET